MQLFRKEGQLALKLKAKSLFRIDFCFRPRGEITTIIFGCEEKLLYSSSSSFSDFSQLPSVRYNFVVFAANSFESRAKPTLFRLLAKVHLSCFQKLLLAAFWKQQSLAGAAAGARRKRKRRRRSRRQDKDGKLISMHSLFRRLLLLLLSLLWGRKWLLFG